MSWHDVQRDLTQEPQRPCQLPVCQVVAHLTTLTGCADQPAAAQASKMIRDVGSTLTQLVSEIGWIRRPIQQTHQDPPAHPISHRGTDAAKGDEPAIHTHVNNHTASIVQQRL